MTRGRVVTEHDVRADRWYLGSRPHPDCIAVEAGQADLFLSGYLGIDFETRGPGRLPPARRRRDVPPRPAAARRDDPLRHPHRPASSARATRYLFRFRFDGTVDGEPLMTMRDGCAGFFTAEALAAGKGIVHTALDRQPLPGVRPDDWRDLVPHGVECRYDDAQVDALRARRPRRGVRPGVRAAARCATRSPARRA